MRDIDGDRSRDLGCGKLGTVRGTVSMKARLMKAGDYSQRELFKVRAVRNRIRGD